MIKKSKGKIAKEKRKGKLVIQAVLFTFLLLVLALSFRFDFKIARFVTSLQSPLLNKAMLYMTYLGSSIAILFILTSLFLWHEHKRRWIVPLWVSLFFSGLFVVAIKLVSARVRPFYLGLPTLNIFINKFLWWDTSFPSFHAAIAFSALPVLDKEFPRFKFVWFAFACLVGFSRIYFALHFLSDVIAGAVLGYAVGILATRLEERYHYSEIVKMLIRKR